MQKRGDIDAIRNALRPRMGKLSIAGGSAPPNTVPPHTHAAAQITVEPAGNIAADDVQEALEELDSEKLARDGTQPMLGHLDMNHNDVQNVNDAEVERDLTVGNNATMTGGVGIAVLDGPRVVHAQGAESDGEARIDGINALVFQDSVSPTPEARRVGWEQNEGALVAFPPCGSGGVTQVALGWTVYHCLNGEAPI